MAVFLWDFCVQGGEGVHEIYLLGSYAFLAAAFCFLRCRLNDNEQKGSLSSTICCFGMSSSLGFCFVGGGRLGSSNHRIRVLAPGTFEPADHISQVTEVYGTPLSSSGLGFVALFGNP